MLKLKYSKSLGKQGNQEVIKRETEIILNFLNKRMKNLKFFYQNYKNLFEKIVKEI